MSDVGGAATVAVGADRLELTELFVAGAPYVLLCHGFPGEHLHWDVATALHARGFSTGLLRYRGAGRSDGTFTFRGAPHDVLAAVDAVAARGAPRVGIFGYSAGAYYAFAAASRDPRIAAICAVAPVVDLPRAARTEVENIYDLMCEAPRLLRVRSVGDLVASYAELWHDFNLPALLPALSVPTLLVDGDDETTGDPYQGRLLLGLLPSARAEILAGANHYLDRPADRTRLAAAVAAFFERTLVDP